MKSKTKIQILQMNSQNCVKDEESFIAYSDEEQADSVMMEDF